VVVIRQNVTLDGTIAFLNELTAIDRVAMTMLLTNLVPCSKDLVKHPTVQVGEGQDGIPIVGLLGILNGLFGIDDDGWGAIAAVFEDGKLVEFVKTDTVSR